MSLYTSSCQCCGAVEKRGCVAGFACNCGGYHDDIGNLVLTTCARCHQCMRHCKCSEGFITPRQMINWKEAQLKITGSEVSNAG